MTSQIGSQHFDMYQSDTTTAYQPHGGLSRSIEFVNHPDFTTDSHDVNHSRHLMDLLGASHDANTNQQAQRLSLSLGSHSLVSSFTNPSYMNQEIDQRNNEYSFSAAAMNQSFSNVCGTESFVSAIGNSKYLKPTQSLLEELVCIGGKTIDSSNEKFIRRLSRNSKRGSLSLRAMLKGEIPPSNELFNERHELYVKIMKLIVLLEEVERRYEQYYQHMEEVTSTFEVIAGFGAGKAYTALALQAMSRHFCCLRDAIISQINVIRQKMLRDVPKISSGLSHLSLFEKETLQNRISLQQLGIIQGNRQAWRPIRGLPETSVAILRSWLFEHFLHPYPNDSEKLMLSSQTGLSKNQVSNWFINARVRLWKPMIEEMYKEEFAESSVESDNLLNREELELIEGLGEKLKKYKVAVGEEIGVLSPDDSLSVRNPVIEEETVPESEVNEVENGVASVVAEEKAQTWISKSENKEKLDEEDENASRFKLRNGREVFEEKAYLVGVACKGDTEDSFGIEESLKELAQLADTAGLLVVDSTYQKLSSPNPRTYIGSGKVSEIKSAIRAFDVETVIFDDELSPGQLRNLEKAFGGDVRVCDRTALILDIFNQRAATREASLQVSLAQMEYQLPRLTRMWTHLERQAGGQVKGMGEKQIEVDKRILRTQIGVLKKELESVRKHRKQYRNRRVSVPVPVVSLVGYTNAGKSTLLNQLTGADVLAEDRLFATLDPTTRRVQMKNGKEFLLTDTVGFIQKLPTTLVAAFRATLEEIAESSILVHVADISHPLAEQQIEAVEKVLSELDTSSIPKLMLWNKVDKAEDPEKIKLEAKTRNDVVCVSALTGEGLDEFCNEIQNRLKDAMVWVEALIPFDKGELLSTIHQVGMVERTEYTEKGTLVRAHVPLRFARLLTPMRQMCVS
ncbi:hypothetical protein KY284_021675 [Solanum tuberosum]|nr:hypothetical protein KY284_021675 [Solanum tuberosum]